MKNQYMFFAKQTFDGVDVAAYSIQDTLIPKTDVHIYEFSCVEEGIPLTDEENAKKLDELTQLLETNYGGLFQLIISESSQFFCSQLYPLIVQFETKLRYALYISQALYNQGKVDATSFLYTVGKTKKSIEDTDFGEIYESIFADANFKPTLMKQYSENLTKADLLKIIQATEENTEWQKIIGKDYNYIESHFLEIKSYRNHVMHNHLISFDTYNKAFRTLLAANNELDRAINDKLITNSSDYSNQVSTIEVIGNIVKALGMFALRLNRFSNSNEMENVRKFATLMVNAMISNVNPQELPAPDSEEPELEETNNA